MKATPHVTAIILAAGSGSRMDKLIPKQKMLILGESVLSRSVRAFSDCEKIKDILVVCRAEDLDLTREELASFTKVISVISGGKTRAESAKIGFNSISPCSEYVAIHDAARCLITPEKIASVVDSAICHGAATAGTFITDTVKHLEDGMIDRTVPREHLFSAQTPQVFSREIYQAALNNTESIEAVTDDNMLVESLGIGVCPVDTGKSNIKLTRVEDIAFAEYIIERRRPMEEIRFGHGYDVHRLVDDRRLILGGVDIPHDKGLLGHSDADVLTHAIMDAILGACGLGDIGRHFSDTDPSYKDISSLYLLKKVSEIIHEQGFSIVNIDATLVIQRPKIAPYVEKMRENIADILKIDLGKINIKATTEEKLGFTGREEGIAAHSVCTVKK